MTGIFLKLPIFEQVPREHLFDDELSWEVPEEEHEMLHQQSYLARDRESNKGHGKRPGSDGPEPAMIPLMRR